MSERMNNYFKQFIQKHKIFFTNKTEIAYYTYYFCYIFEWQKVKVVFQYVITNSAIIFERVTESFVQPINSKS